MIEVNNLKKTFIKDGNKIEVLRGLNLEIAKGDSLAILGVSGAGKSTFLNILGVLDHPSSGDVLYNGADAFSWNEQKQAEFRNQKIGFVFQSHHLLPEFTSLENTMMPALINGMPLQEARKRAEIILTEVGLGDRLPHKPGVLSGGEQQRVAIARGLVHNPKLLLADEPTGNLDSKTGEKIMNVLLRFNREHKQTILMVTHDEDLTSEVTRSIYIKDGRLLDQ